MNANATQECAVRALKEGKPVVFPTDTLFGLGVSVLHAQSPEILYQIKQREQRKPIAWLVGSVADLDKYGKVVPEYARTLARTFWPGPLTIIVKASAEVPTAFCSSQGTIGLRMPNSEAALGLIKQVGCPLATTSANVSGQPDTVVFENIAPEVIQRVGAALNDEEVKSGVASTIVDCASGHHPVLVREGAITVAQIRALS